MSGTMKEFNTLTADQWVGFATRKIFLHWLRTAGQVCAVIGGIVLIPGGFGLLSVLDDLSKNRPVKDLELEVVMLVVGVGLLLVGSLLIMFDALRLKREIERGELKATGVFWNFTTNEKLEGIFEFNIDPGSVIFDKPKIENRKPQKPMPIRGVVILSLFCIVGLTCITAGIWSCCKGDMGGAIGIVLGLFFAAFPIGILALRKMEFKVKPTGFNHTCKAIRHDATQARAMKVQQMSKPNLRLRFSVSNQLVEGEFASCVFNKRSDLDTIVFAKGLIIRAKGLKADPCAFCTEIGKLLKDQAPNMIDVQLAVHWVRNLPSSSQSSNAGVIGAGLFGAVGGAVGAVIAEKKEQRQRQEQVAQQAAHDQEARTLLRRLEKVAAEFEWTATM